MKEFGAKLNGEQKRNGGGYLSKRGVQLSAPCIYLYLNLYININKDNIKVTALASINGKSDIVIP